MQKESLYFLVSTSYKAVSNIIFLIAYFVILQLKLAVG